MADGSASSSAGTRPVRRLTVLQLVPQLHSGGVERGTVEVACELARRGHLAIVVSGGGALVGELQAAGVVHVAWDIWKKSPLSLRFVPRLRRLIRDRGVDIVHARSRMPAWIGYLAWRGLAGPHGPRFVTTVHGLHSVNAYSAVMTKGERVIAVSEAVRDYLLSSYAGIEPGRIRVIHRGVDPRRFPPGHQASAQWLAEWYAHYPQLRGRFVITLAGRLTRLKGHADFLEVIARLHASGARVHGLIVGDDGGLRDAFADDLKRRVRERSLPVVFAGRRDDMRDVYAASDVVLSLSQRPESFGRTVLEALSVGVPVIGYRHGGVGEILERVYPRGAVDRGDLGAVVSRIVELMKQPQPPAPRDVFQLQDMLDRTLDLYAELRAERRS